MQQTLAYVAFSSHACRAAQSRCVDEEDLCILALHIAKAERMSLKTDEKGAASQQHQEYQPERQRASAQKKKTEELAGGFLTRTEQHSTHPAATAAARQGPSAAQADGDGEAQPRQL
jgi:hypothetical protein